MARISSKRQRRNIKLSVSAWPVAVQAAVPCFAIFVVATARWQVSLPLLFAGGVEVFGIHGAASRTERIGMAVNPAGFPQSQFGDDDADDDLFGSSVEKESDLSPKEVTHRISEAPSAVALFYILGQEMAKPTFDHIHLATAFTRLARNAKSLDARMLNSPVIEDLMQREEFLLQSGSADARHAANVLWAVATLRDRTPSLKRLVPMLLEALDFKANDLSALEMTNTVWACGALRLKRDQLQNLIPVLVERIVDRADELSMQGIANIIWATAVLRRDAPKLQEVLPVLIDMVADLVDNMTAPDVVNMMWAAATLRAEAPCLQQMMPMLMQQAVAKADTLMEQHVANIVWSVGVLKLSGDDVDGLLDTMLGRSLPRVRKFKTQELANLCWGLSLLQSQGLTGMQRASLDAFMASVAEAVAQISPTLKGKAAELDLPQLICSFAKLGVRHQPMLSAIEARTSEMLPRMNDWGLSALTWSYEELGSSTVASPGFLRRAWAEVEKRGIPPAHVGRSRLGPAEWRSKNAFQSAGQRSIR